MSLLVLQGALEQGLIYAFVALGLYISYRTLDIADLTTDGTFALGAACSAIFTTMGHPILGIFASLLAGAAAGGVTALLQTKLRVLPILAGIITMTALYSVNLMVMGNKSNLPMRKDANIFTAAEQFFGVAYGKLILIALILATIVVLLMLFLRTQLGLSLRATGDNRDMVASSSINPAVTTALGLCMANALVALSGALLAQYQKFADVSLGTGMVVIGLAGLIIGEVLLVHGTRAGIVRGILAAVVGSVLYRVLMAAAISSNVNANNLKLVSALIVAAAISYPAIREKIEFHKLRKAAAKHA
ncbi:MAG: ABC transporter permease [Ruthenibacterium sp.]